MLGAEMNEEHPPLKRFAGIGELVSSENANEMLIASNLGSCLGLVVYDREHRSGALIHCLLPSAGVHQEKARANPHLYVDVGVKRMLEPFLERQPRRARLLIVATGCAAFRGEGDMFEIGRKNFTMLRKVLWEQRLFLSASDVGAHACRTVSLSIASGEVWLRSDGRGWKLA